MLEIIQVKKISLHNLAIEIYLFNEVSVLKMSMLNDISTPKSDKKRHVKYQLIFEHLLTQPKTLSKRGLMSINICIPTNTV